MSIDKVIAKVNKRFGAGTICRASEAEGLKVQRFSSGSYALDVALGGGFIEGRVNELVGQFSSYKSTLAVLSCLAYLKISDDRYVVWLDIEHTFDVQWLKFLGGDANRFLLVDPTSGEEAVDVLCTILDEKDPVLVVLDSIAALVSNEETEQSMVKNDTARQARFVSKMLRKVMPRLKRDLMAEAPKKTIIALNQVRVQIGVFWGDPENAPGGKSLEHNVSVRVKLRRKGYIYEELKGEGETIKQSVGSNVSFTVQKNKTGGNVMDKGIFTFYNRAHKHFSGGTIDNAGDLIPLALVYGIVRRKGTTFYYEGLKAVGKEKFCRKLYMRPSVCNDLFKDIMKEHWRRIKLKRYGDKNEHSTSDRLSTRGNACNKHRKQDNILNF